MTRYNRAWWVWGLAVVLGPLVGWGVTDLYSVSYQDWEWRYWARIIVTVAVPLLTALPLLRREMVGNVWARRGLIVVISLLPLVTVMNTILDLEAGPARAFGAYPPTEPGGEPIDFEYEFLQYTDRELEWRP